MILSDDQLAAVKKMRNGCILCGGTGSGKSRTALAYYYICQGGDIKTLKTMDNPLKLYIITTAQKRDIKDWVNEMIIFGIVPDEVVVDSWNKIKQYANIKNSFFIFDEDKVTGTGVWAKTFIKIAKANKWILLSATPGDTWSDYMAVFIANGFYKNMTDFRRKHIVYKPYMNYPVVDRYIDTGILNKYRREILVDIRFDRHTTQHHEDIWCNYDKEKYKGIVKTRWNPFKNEPIQNASEYCQVLRKIVNTSDSRQLACLELLEDHPKTIIFYNFDYELDILKNICRSIQGLDIAEWNGHKHDVIPETEHWVYLVQYMAGSEGWNCITTDTIIFYSQSYSYKTTVQAAGRIDRRNTPFIELYLYHLKSKSPIDLSISRCLKNKEDFNEQKFEGGELYFEQ